MYTRRNDNDVDDNDVTGETGDINSIERTKVDLEIVRRRESKWVEMMGSWDTYMMRSDEVQYTQILSIPEPLRTTLCN